MLDPVGTAPGVVVPGKPAVIVLPGPPRELQPMWQNAIQTAAAQEAIAGRTIYRQETIRMFGLPESGLAETLRGAEKSVPGFDKLEITTCLRRGEIEMVTRYEPDAADAYAELTQLLREKHGQQLYSEDGSHVDDLVARLLAGRRIATAESCTAGLLAARLTDRPGSSEYVMGGVVSYSNDAKAELLGVDPALIEAHGAVSEPVAEAMAAGALKRFGADTAVAITGIAGPGGGTPEKPVGTVCFTVKLADGADDHENPAPPRKPLRHPRALDDGGDAPAAARALGREIRLSDRLGRPMPRLLETTCPQHRFARGQRAPLDVGNSNWIVDETGQIPVSRTAAVAFCLSVRRSGDWAFRGRDFPVHRRGGFDPSVGDQRLRR